jgi:hypothetical protein
MNISDTWHREFVQLLKKMCREDIKMSKKMSKMTYVGAVHAMQTGVTFAIKKDPSQIELKHLRVGINSAMCGEAAVARLLIEKGIFTLEEYEEAQRLEMIREVERYKRLLENLYPDVSIQLM